MKTKKIVVRREVKIGLFALVALVSLYLGVNYLKGKDVFSGDRTYYALYDQTGGLQTTAPVLLRGVKVGSVTAITLDEKYPDKVLVEVNVKKSVAIPVDSRLKLFSNGIMGGKAVELVLGSATGVFEKGAVIPSETEFGLLESASAGVGDLIVEAKTMLNTLNVTAASINSVLEQSAGGIQGIVANVDSATKQIADAQVGAMLRDIGHFSAMLKENSGRFEGIIVNLDEVTGQIAGAGLAPMLDTLGMSIGHLNSMLASLSAGEGTAGRLLGDPALYDSLTVATGNLSVLLADLKANPGRYVHLSLFGAKDKEAAEKKKAEKAAAKAAAKEAKGK